MGARGTPVQAALDGDRRRGFMRHLLADLRALEQMLDGGLIEEGVRRIGAEQELFLVDRQMRPACVAPDLLQRLDDPHFTTELGLFNLELNLDPQLFGGDCLSRMERQLEELLGRLRRAAAESEVEIVLTGILPTLRMSDLGLENMTPLERYRELNRAMTGMRGGAYEFHIKGVDELLLKHDSVMLEAANASFQLHVQAGSAEFANLYNIAQIVTAPLLAVGANSPLLFGRRLWSETRIALFQQAVDTRSSMRFLRERSARVTFGSRWLSRSVLELFQEDIARFRALLTADLSEYPLDRLARGEVPRLEALALYNGTVYRWNRACYGVTDGRPHLRIENRVLPAGPTVVDQLANAAFWLGLLTALAARYDDVTRLMDFEDAKMNFRAAARLGLAAPLRWFGEDASAARLIADRLLPLAHEGLSGAGFDASDVERYLGVIERRVQTGNTGAEWLVRSLTQMRGHGAPAERLGALTASIVERQREGRPVAEWEPARLDAGPSPRRQRPVVEQYMTTELFTVAEDESLDLVAHLMEWRRIRHVPVEDAEHRLVGLVSYRTLLRLLAHGGLQSAQGPIPVSSVMKRDPVTIGPEASILEAIDTMREHRVACLPVVQQGQLRGVITERDLMQLAAELLRDKLQA
jgi:CBS domain-containing protein/gamma-glutamylcysteine synthetase